MKVSTKIPFFVVAFKDFDKFLFIDVQDLAVGCIAKAYDGILSSCQTLYVYQELSDELNVGLLLVAWILHLLHMYQWLVVRLNRRRGAFEMKC